MRSFFVCVLAVGLTSVAQSAPQLKAKGLGFNAPQVADKANVFSPNAGDIVYDSSDSGFYGYTQSGSWINFGGSSANIIPAGVIMPFAGATAPTGYLLTDGSPVSRTTYANLFAVVGTTYGPGDGSTTFNLPNTQGIFIRGAGTQTVGAKAYTGVLATRENDRFASHSHRAFSAGGGLTEPDQPNAFGFAGFAGFSRGYFQTFLASGASAIEATGTGTETAPANISMNYIIKY